MSKVVTIPKDRNPFIVIVNGVEYKYPAGATIEVPDSVADVIEKYEGAKPKPDPTPTPGGTGGSVQSDWNQNDSSAADFIKNKPFGDMPTGGDTLYWDGNTEGLVSAEGFYKVSDAVPTMDDVSTGHSVTDGIGGSIGSTQFTSIADGVIMDNAYSVVIVSDIGVGVDLGGVSFQEAGTYFTKTDYVYVSSLTIPGYTGFPVTKKMEEKYLPGAVILYTDGTYLYATEDTSDASKRMTKLELLKTINSGRAVYLTLINGDSTQLNALSNSAITPAFVVAVFGDVGVFTAEYVPEG